MIWFKDYKAEELKGFITHENIVDNLGIEFFDVGPDYVKVRMPVDKRTHQIHGILHGGATCVLAESAGSFASLMVIDPTKYYAVGSQLLANHLRPVSDGFVTATCTPIHLGRRKHVWDIPVHADNGKLIAKCELTCMVTDKG
ncbi:MAG: PaaI family thioesterase [Rhodospirillales bacterium]|nr:PaaI family thioesterase [Rhodospirillales bacterium]MCB9995352.1 PaaI family thioesterase [Rhodospirillales bacterium]